MNVLTYPLTHSLTHAQYPSRTARWVSSFMHDGSFSYGFLLAALALIAVRLNPRKVANTTEDPGSNTADRQLQCRPAIQGRNRILTTQNYSPEAHASALLGWDEWSAASGIMPRYSAYSLQSLSEHWTTLVAPDRRYWDLSETIECLN